LLINVKARVYDTIRPAVVTTLKHREDHYVDQ